MLKAKIVIFIFAIGVLAEGGNKKSDLPGLPQRKPPIPKFGKQQAQMLPAKPESLPTVPKKTDVALGSMNKLKDVVAKKLIPGQIKDKKLLANAEEQPAKPEGPDEKEFLARLASELNPPLNIDIRDKWLSLRLTREAASDYTVQYKNMTHIAFEVVLENTTPSQNSKLAVQKPKAELYNKFIKLVKTFSPFLVVQANEYELFTRTFGSAEAPAKIWLTKNNLDVYLLRPRKNGEFPQMRFFIDKEFKVPRPKGLFEGSRLGLMQLDSEISTLWDKCFPQEEDPKKPKRTAECQSSSAEFKSAAFNLHYKVENTLYIFELQVNENDSAQLLEDKLELLRKQQELIMSKKLLRNLGLIGFHNTEDGAWVNLKLTKPKSTTFVALQYLTRLRSQEKFTVQVGELLANLKRNCARRKNEVIVWNLLGVSAPERSIVGPSYKLEAFETENEVNYVFVYNDYKGFRSVDPWQEARDQLGEFTCAYHDDDYYTGKKLNEVYLMTFSVPKAQNKAEIAKI